MTTPTDPPAAPGRWRRRIALILLVLGTVVGGGWRYRITRPEYRLERGREAVLARDAETARAYADRLEAAGHLDHAHLLRGEALHAFGAPGPAIEQFNKIQSEGPLRLQAAALSGRCLLELGELEQAHRVFSFVLTEQPDHLDALRGLGAIAYDLGRLDEAIAHLARVAELDSTDARPHRLIGLINKDMAQYPPAEAAYREALQRGPPPEVEREVRAELAEVCVRQGRFAEGLEVLESAAPEAKADGPAAVAVRAESLRGLGRLPEAADALDAALARNSTAALHRLRGLVYQDQGKPADALQSYERAVALDPADHQSHYQLGQVLAGLGRKDDAARAFGRAEELRKDLDRITALSREAMHKPWDPVVRRELADVCDRLNKPQLAAMWRKAAAACRPPAIDAK